MERTHFMRFSLVVFALAVFTPGALKAQGGEPGGGPTAQERGEWVPITPLLVARQEGGVAALNGKIYVLGGMQGGVRLTSVEIYDPATRKWTFGPSLPEPVFDHMGTAVVDGKLYSIGGIDVNGAVAKVFMLDPATGKWLRKADMPTPRGATGVAVIDGKIYVAGGYYARNSMADFARYDPAKDKWEVLPPMPTPRDHLVAAAINGKFHAIGGQRLVRKVGPVLGTHEVFDPATGKWSAAAPMPTARAGMGIGALRGRLQVFGGEGNTHRQEGTFDENEEYDPTTNTWRTLAPMPSPRHGSFGAVLGDVIYAPGGGPKKGFSDTAEADLFRFPPPPPPPGGEGGAGGEEGGGGEGPPPPPGTPPPPGG